MQHRQQHSSLETCNTAMRLPPFMLLFSKTTHHSNTLRSASTVLAHSFSVAHLNFKQHPNSSSMLNFASIRLPPFMLLFSKTTHHFNTFLRSAPSTALDHPFSDADLIFKQKYQYYLFSDSEIEFAPFSSSDSESDNYCVNINADLIWEMCYSGLDKRLELNERIHNVINVTSTIGDPLYDVRALFEKLLKDVDVGTVISNQNHDLLKAFDAFVEVYVSLNLFENAVDLLFQIKSYGILPNLVACSFLINRLIKHGEVDMAYEVLQAYRGSLVPIDVLASYTTLIRWYCSNRELDKAESMLLDMEKQGIVPHVQIYSPLICGYCKAHNLHKALDLLGDKDLNCEIACSVLHCFGEMGMDSFVVRMFKWPDLSGVVWDGLAYNFVFHALCKLGKVDDAVGMLEELKSLDIKHYTTLISGYCLQGKPDEAFSMFKEMKEKGFMPDAVTYTILINSYCRKNCLQEAYGLFQDMKRRDITPDVIIYTVLLDWSLTTATIWRGLKDVVSYTVLIDGHIKKDRTQEAITLFDEVIDRGLEPDTVTYTALISGFYNNRGHTKEVVDLLDGKSPKAALKRGIIKARKVQFH